VSLHFWGFAALLFFGYEVAYFNYIGVNVI